MQLALVAVMVTIASVTAFSPIPPRRSTTPNAVVLASTARDGAEVEGAVVSIRYCTGCNWMLRATWMTQELLTTFDDGSVREVRLQPQQARPGGEFIVAVGDAVVWDRRVDGGFPQPKELKRRVRDVIAPERDLGHSDRAEPAAPPPPPLPPSAASTTVASADREGSSGGAVAVDAADWEADEEQSHRASRRKAFGGDCGGAGAPPSPAGGVDAAASGSQWGDWTKSGSDVSGELAKLMALGRDAAVRRLEDGEEEE